MTSLANRTRHDKELIEDGERNPALEFAQDFCWLIYRYSDGTFELLAVLNEDIARAWGKKGLTSSVVSWKRLLRALTHPVMYKLTRQIGERHSADEVKRDVPEGHLSLQFVFTAAGSYVPQRHRIDLQPLGRLEAVATFASWNRERALAPDRDGDAKI